MIARFGANIGMERHLSTGIATLVALMEAGRAQEQPRPNPGECPWLRVIGRPTTPDAGGQPTDETRDKPLGG